MNNSPREMLELGVAILAPALEPHGYVYSSSTGGTGSGGTFAIGTFSRENRQLTLHHRWGLGIITFGVGQYYVPHADYVTFLGDEDRSKLIWLTTTSGLERYRALRSDLETLLTDFTTGDASGLIAAANGYAERKREEGVHLNAQSAGDPEKCRLARDAFKCGRYPDVIELIGSIAYPELLTGSETRMVEIARTRIAGTEQSDERGAG